MGLAFLLIKGALECSSVQRAPSNNGSVCRTLTQQQATEKSVGENILFQNLGLRA